MRRISVLFTLLLVAATVSAGLPEHFLSQALPLSFDLATGLRFGSDGRMYVWEKGGRVWLVENGVKSAQPLIDIHDEVGNWGDYGLLGFTLDPNFDSNGQVYLLYVVDYYYLTTFGQAGYDPNVSIDNHDTIGRLTRYTLNAADNFHSVDYASRRILIGESMSTGFPLLNTSHGVGSLAFGADGSLIAGCGDGASFANIDTGGPAPGSSNTGLQDGIITPKEDVGAYRAQLVDGLNGKMVRIDPATGDGLPSNPFFDPNAPRAGRSRMWAMGFRNPFRFTFRPGTGSSDPSAGNPGTLYIGDVGFNTWEELNVCKTGGLNFGWPVFEGLEAQPSYSVTNTPDQDAPNPLFGTPGCPQHYFFFRQLLVQDTLAATSFPNPCDPGQQVPASIPHFEHTRPAIDWQHTADGPSRTGIYNGNDAAVIRLDDPNSPVPGPNFGGNCSVGGLWYTSNVFPPEYQNAYFHGDYGQGWIRVFHFDANDNPVSVSEFGTGLGGVVCLAVGPDGFLYYLAYGADGVTRLYKLGYYPNNLPPTAAASATPYYGAAPLTVQFSSAGSVDPENLPLSYAWDFGDGSTVSHAASPTHTYPDPDITPQGTFIGKIFTLNPPHPLGGGNYDPEIMRDGVYPPVNSGDPLQQYDTFHNGDQGANDWIGYQFAAPQTFTGLTFQEGVQFSDGGWFINPKVEVRVSGVWTAVSGLAFTPAYGGRNNISFEKYQIAFTPMAGDAIRLTGRPGGSNNFISVGELRVQADVTAPPGPTPYHVTLTVTDALGVSSATTLLVSLNNTPPFVQITSPVDGATYSIAATTTVPLTADVSDAEQGSGLSCAWQTILHHNDHIHPEPLDPNCTSSTTFQPVGCDGNTYFYEVRLTVTDNAGLTTAQSVFVYPDCPPPCASPACEGFDLSTPPDCIVDLSDLAVFITHYGQTGEHIPGDTQAPLGVVDLADLSAFLSKYGLNCN